MSQKVDYTIRKGCKEDLLEVAALGLDEGWFVSSQIVQIVYDADPEGSYVAVTSSGEVIGHCLSTNMDNVRGSLQLYVVKKCHRGKGIGKQLLNLCKEHLGDRNIVLNSVKDEKIRAMHKKNGLKIPSFRLWLSIFTPVRIAVKKSLLGVDILPYKKIFLPSVLEYDMHIQPCKRESQLEKYLEELVIVTYVAFEGPNVVGYGCLAPGRFGTRLLPLYADSPAIASCLIQELFGHVSEGSETEVCFISENLNNAQVAFSGTGIENPKKIFEAYRLYSHFEEKIASTKVYTILNYQNCIV